MALIAIATSGVQAHAQLQIVPTFDATLTSKPNAADYEAAFNYAASQFTSVFGNNTTINIVVALGDSGGSSVTTMSTSYSYTELRAALASHSSIAAASLPATDPFNGAQTYGLTTANAQAIGLPILTVANGTLPVDGVVTLEPNVNFHFDPAHPGGTTFDFVGTAEHEISEVLGRTQNLPDSLLPFDLYRFKSAGVRSIDSADTGVYFSTDNGTTKIKGFNGPTGGDLQDWDTADPTDAFNFSGSSSTISHMTAADITALEAIGYTPVPEPRETAFAMLLGAVALVGFRRWQTRRA